MDSKKLNQLFLSSSCRRKEEREKGRRGEKKSIFSPSHYSSPPFHTSEKTNSLNHSLTKWGRGGFLLALSLSLLLLTTACRPPERTATADTETTPSTTGTAQAQGEQTTETVASSDPVTPTRQETARSVRVVTATTGALSAQKSASVTIEPLQESSVAAGATGRVEQILKREGQRVEEGEVVITLDDDSANLQVQNAQLALDSAQINLEKARRATTEGGSQIEIQLRSAQTNYDVLKQQYDESLALFEVGGVSQNQLDQLSAQLTQAEATLVQLQNSLAQNQRASTEDLSLLELQVSQASTALQQAQDALAETQIRAPFAGEVSDVLTEQGEFLAAGSPAFRLVSTDEQIGTFSVPPADAQKLLAQGELIFRYQGLDYGARIVRSNAAPNDQRLIDITAEIYPSETPIPSGSVAQLNYTIQEASGILIPASAVVSESGQNYVYVVENNRAKRTAVQILAEVSGQAAISGIREGTRVIFPLPNDLRDNAMVRVLE
jgi:HlyD family secretion protein